MEEFYDLCCSPNIIQIICDNPIVTGGWPQALSELSYIIIIIITFGISNQDKQDWQGEWKVWRTQEVLIGI